MLKKVIGIVIKETPYKETSKIINIFTEELGIIGVIARGTKSIKSPLSGVTNKLTYGYFHIQYKENTLSTLVAVDVIDTLKYIKKDLMKISYATYITELTEQVFRHEQNADLFELYLSSIIKINEGYDPLVITNILELKLLEYLGIRPILDECSVCGNKSNIVTISCIKGGYICKNCYQNEFIVNTKTIKLLRMFYYLDIKNITKTEIAENIKKEINMFIDEYYDRYAGLYLRSKEFLKNIEQIS